MGNSSSKKQKKLQGNDIEYRTIRDCSPWRRGRSELGDDGDCPLIDVPGKPSKAVVSLTNLQSDKPTGSCVTDSIYLDWARPATDGGRPILGYTVEMYDLPTGNWVLVTNTEGIQTRTMLDNILCGIMYRFRIRAFNEIGSSIPGIPSDAFVIDTPGVHIAPYFILCPPAETTKYAHQSVQFRAKALGTPKPNILWEKDNEPIFITEGIDIQDEPDGSLLTVHNLQVDDEGVIQCIAVNQVGKAVASTNLTIVALPKFKRTSTAPLQFTFRAEEMIRLKFPFVSNPPSEFTLMKGGKSVADSHEADVSVRDEDVLFRIESARMDHSGRYSILADNGNGEDRIDFDLDVEVPPESPGCPEVSDVTPTGQVSLSWEPPKSSPVDHYIIEYYRDQWQLWLRLKTTIDTQTLVTDLIPGSKYKFRVMSASLAGISDPSPPSEEVMVGVAAEDELFDLPRNTRGRSSSRLGHRRQFNKLPSLERGTGATNRRQTSLDREVYYDADNVRKEVVTYKPVSDSATNNSKIGTLSNKYKLSNDEMVKYKTSMSDLCNKMKAISNNSLIAQKQQEMNSSDAATQPLKREVLSQARKYNSSNLLSSKSHVDQNGMNKSYSSSQLTKHQSELTGDVSECKKSLSDIRDRIGSLQSLLKQSKSLTSSRQQLLAETPVKAPLVTPAEALKKEHFASHRNNSYSKAMDDEGEQLQETHFPYNNELSNLLCDKPENRQSRSPVVKERMQNGVANKFDIRALSPTDATVIPLMSPEPDSTMSTVTLLADNTDTGTLVSDTDKTDLVSESDRTISACSTLDGEDDLQSDTDSLL